MENTKHDDKKSSEKKPQSGKVDKASLEASIAEKKKAVTTNQIVKK